MGIDLYLEELGHRFRTFETFKSHITRTLSDRDQIKANYSLLSSQHRVAGVLLTILVPQVVISKQINPVPYTHLLYEKRADTMKNHPSDIAFPGGTLEQVDSSPKDAAYREAKEEVGINPDDLEFISYMDEFVSSSNILVHPVVSVLIEDEPLDTFSKRVAQKYYPRTSESTDTVVLPLTHLLDPEFYESERYSKAGSSKGWVRYFHTTGYRRDDYVWGLTASMTRRFLNEVFPDNPLPDEP